MNQVIIAGTVSFAKNMGKVAVFSVKATYQVEGRGEFSTYVKVKAFQPLANLVGTRLNDGSNVKVTGVLKNEKYTNKAGVEVNELLVIADAIEGFKPETAPASRPRQIAVTNQRGPSGNGTPVYAEPEDEQEIPF